MALLHLVFANLTLKPGKLYFMLSSPFDVLKKYQKLKDGGDEGNRTLDPLRAKQMLYP